MAFGSLVVCAVLASAVQAGQSKPDVTVESLLGQMASLRMLARLPDPYFHTAQSSSYDRESKEPGKEGWFANGDAGKFIAVEQKGELVERVMADLSGPGAVVRIWSANPSGVLRFYFDGEKIPSLRVDAAALLSGKLLFPNPFAYESSQGFNLYFPLPYAKSLKITVDNSNSDGSRSMYYHVGYRTYPGLAADRIVTFDASKLPLAEMKRAADALTGPAPSLIARHSVTATLELAPKASETLALSDDKAGAVIELAMRVRGRYSRFDLTTEARSALERTMRRIVLELAFDGETTVRAPLGDFFGSGPGRVPYKSLPFSVNAEGRMECRFPMPFRRSAMLKITNFGDESVQMSVGSKVANWTWDDRTCYFRAQWQNTRGQSRPFVDLPILRVVGSGTLVGTHLLVANNAPGWWGEGDEKIRIDDEPFPSTFGTGTEDYFGYAWCSNRPFQRPYHAQTRADGPSNFGFSSVNRWHILDALPFQKGIQFDLERWHSQDVSCDYARTVYWYGRPGSTGPAFIKPEDLELPVLEPPRPIKDGVEGELMRVLKNSGGKITLQEGFAELSNSRQLWWTDVAEADELELAIPVAEAGRYRVSAQFCSAPDYGIHQITIAGNALDPIDFYQPSIVFKVVALGEMELEKGETVLKVKCMGANPAAAPGRMFGLDYVRLEKL